MGDQEIRNIAKGCQTAIATLLAATKNDDSHVRDLVNERNVEEMQERFDQWAGNLGAFQAPKLTLSLEHRLRNSPVIKNAILRTLADLYDSVQAATDITTGRRSNRTAGPIIDSDTDLAEYDVSSSDSDSSISSTSSFGNVPQGTSSTSEIQELMSAIKIGLDYLFKTSVFIRKFAPKDKRQRASSTKPFDNRADAMYISDRYPLVAKKNEALRARLAEANARRRQYFKYRRDHNDRLSRPDTSKETPISEPRPRLHPQPVDQSLKSTKSVLSEQTKPSLWADTEATEFVDHPLADAQLSTLLNPPPTMSVVSFATSIVESPEDNLSFPSMPAEAPDNSSFLCPYCLMIVPLKPNDKDNQWRKHVLEDLEPYICTFPGCGLDSYLSQHAWFEHELLMHRNSWEIDSNHFVGLPDRDAMSAGYRWVRDDCGRGWSIISSRRATFIAMAFFLAKYRMRLQIPDIRISETPDFNVTRTPRERAGRLSIGLVDIGDTNPTSIFERPVPRRVKVRVTLEWGQYIILVVPFNTTYQDLVDLIDAKLSGFTNSSINSGTLKLRYLDEDGYSVVIEDFDDIQIASTKWHQRFWQLNSSGEAEIELFCGGDSF
ncbi:hypothetical protein CEP52_008511 [Fusarium oligoseptatum]|uniref:Oxidoreductase acuF-like C2H2 type zinc-finger domain-containing protein n=1 Tax=Fusarium oligoseptatum TaxID=2604345 RepID=A0A428THT7_9HYPO|nr:hypothetical protein CEP52_008511 [Fusarium oligoseptatum]